MRPRLWILGSGGCRLRAGWLVAPLGPDPDPARAGGRATGPAIRAPTPARPPLSLAAASLGGSFTRHGDGNLLRLGLQAYQLGIAWEFDPYFGLSISRVDPLPHPLEAVYDYLLELARMRFLLADDAGAGKTIMAGLLLRELKLRGLAERVLANALSALYPKDSEEKRLLDAMLLAVPR